MVGEPTREGGRGMLNFTRESIGELKKVEWPGQSQVVQATTVVIIACVIVGTWLYANDFIWQRVFKNFLLK
jgi:preprotein translocase SecE subunit